MLIEGTRDDIKRNEKKGVSWMREAAANEHVDSMEYMAYYDIRFEKVPNVKRIIGYLEEVMRLKKTNTARAANTLAEFYLAQNAVKGNDALAFDLTRNQQSNNAP